MKIYYKKADNTTVTRNSYNSGWDYYCYVQNYDVMVFKSDYEDVYRDFYKILDDHGIEYRIVNPAMFKTSFYINQDSYNMISLIFEQVDEINVSGTLIMIYKVDD